MTQLKKLIIKEQDLNDVKDAVYMWLNAGDLNSAFCDTRTKRIKKAWNKYVKPVVKKNSRATSWNLELDKLAFVNNRLEYMAKCIENNRTRGRCIMKKEQVEIIVKEFAIVCHKHLCKEYGITYDPTALKVQVKNQKRTCGGQGVITIGLKYWQYHNPTTLKGEYRSYAGDSTIGDIDAKSLENKIKLSVAHEISHFIQYSYFAGKRDYVKPHGNGFKRLYRTLRKDIVNPLIADTVQQAVDTIELPVKPKKPVCQRTAQISKIIYQAKCYAISHGRPRPELYMLNNLFRDQGIALSPVEILNAIQQLGYMDIYLTDLADMVTSLKELFTCLHLIKNDNKLPYKARKYRLGVETHNAMYI